MQQEQLIGPIQEKWLQSLEQHPERQQCGRLGVKRGKNEYTACCLGQLLINSGKDFWDGRLLYSNDSGNLSSGSLEGVWQDLGLYGPYGERYDDNANARLSVLNDTGTTWPEIAAIIRADPKAYLSKAV